VREYLKGFRRVAQKELQMYLRISTMRKHHEVFLSRMMSMRNDRDARGSPLSPASSEKSCPHQDKP